MIKIIIIDDDPLVVSSLATILSQSDKLKVLATGHSGEEALELTLRFKPDVLMMDIRMGELNGIEAGKTLLQHMPDLKILYLTTFLDDEYISEALNMGAKGYLLKQNYDSLLPTIMTIASGQQVYGDAVMTKMPDLMGKNKDKHFKSLGLSDKEVEIIEYVAKGLSNKEISEAIFLSEGTVRNYISQILDRLELRDRTQLAIFYYKQ